MSSDANNANNAVDQVPAEDQRLANKRHRNKRREENRRVRSLIPFWCAAVLFALVPVARWFLFETDHQFANLAGAGIAILGCVFVAIGIWQVFAKTLLQKLLFLATPLVVAGIGFSLFEFVGMTGETVPVFRPRQWSNVAPAQASTPAVAVDQESPPLGVVPTADAIPIASSQFLGPDRNGIVQDDRFSVAWSEQLPSVLWKIPIGAGWSSFAIRDGLAVTFEQIDAQECLTAFSLTTGQVVWRFKTPGKHYHPMGGLGPRSTPTIFGENVYSQSALGIISCVVLRTGEPVWQQDLLKLAGVSQEQSESAISWGRSGSPLVFEDQVVIPFGGKTGDPSLKTLISLDKNTGKVLWTGGDQQISYSSPALLTLRGVRQIVSVNEGAATGHDPHNGNVLWSTPWPSRSNGEACSSQPVAVDDHRLLLGKGYALGSKLIDVQCSGGDAGRQWDPANWKVETVWASNKIMKTKFTSALFYEGMLYGLSDGVLECIDPKDGTRVWRGKRYGHGQAIIVNGHLLVIAEDGRVALIPASESSRGKEVAEMPILDGITWNVPAVAGPYLLVRNAEFAACLLSPKRTGQDAGSPPNVQ